MKKKIFLLLSLNIMIVIALTVFKPTYKTYTITNVKFCSPWRFSPGGVYIKTKENRDIFLSFVDYEQRKSEIRSGKVKVMVGLRLS